MAPAVPVVVQLPRQLVGSVEGMQQDVEDLRLAARDEP
jgi:hypothetical protein